MIRKCIATEERSSRFFHVIAGQVSEDPARQLLLEMASNSERHADLLRSVYHDQEGRRGLDSLSPNVINGLKEHIKLEEEVVKFYEKMSHDTSLKPDIRMTFIELNYDERKLHELMQLMITGTASQNMNLRRVIDIFGTIKNPITKVASQT